MFRRLMVANRGEVAVRVARTCRELGVRSVAVYSDVDGDSPWLDAFDERVCIGPTRAYLDQDALLQAATQSEVQALHPGWGFLAENPFFAARVKQRGIAWVGPSPHAIRLMGDKVQARATMVSLGVPTIPGSDGLLDTADDAARLADSIGYPVMLKATAGGGGRGMRLCHDDGELRRAFVEASQEAASAFGNDGLYMEKFIERGRHIEFQLLGDAFGHAIHLGERECSVQRRHQKLIEEAPSPAIDDATRKHYGELLARAASELRYEGAGTIELLRAQDGEIYFMEMNTRLQVEHPVTEMITGVDLVEQQLRVAANQQLAIEQQDISLRGHAIEARINAEDPAQGFQPMPGPITKFEFGDGGSSSDAGSVRVDTHVRVPDSVSPFYDSLIAKVIAFDETRDAARQRLIKALSDSSIEDVPTTIPAHLQVLAHDGFARGEYDTGLVGQLDLTATS